CSSAPPRSVRSSPSPTTSCSARDTKTADDSHQRRFSTRLSARNSGAVTMVSAVQQRPGVETKLPWLLVAGAVVGCAPYDTTSSPDSASSDLAPPAVSDAAMVSRDLSQPPPPPPDMATNPAKKVLPFVWEGEQYYYYCGPSSARMALSTRMSN